MCTIFFQNRIKLILLPYKAMNFAISTINILIIDVNLADINRVKAVLSLRATCGAFIEETFTV